MSSRMKVAWFPMDFSLKRWLLTQADFFFSQQNYTKHEKHENNGNIKMDPLESM